MFWLMGCGPPGSPSIGEPADPEVEADEDTAIVEAGGFRPFLVSPEARFAFDPATGTTRSYLDEAGKPAGTTIRLTLVAADAAFFGVSSDDLASFGCGVVLVADPAVPVPSETWIVDDAGTAYLGFTFPPGSFSVHDDPAPAIGMPGCSERTFDPARFPEGSDAWLSDRTWRLGVGPIDPGIAAAAEDQDPYWWWAHDIVWDLVVGASIGSSYEPDPSWIAYAWPFDDDDRPTWGHPIVWWDGWTPSAAVYDLTIADWKLVPNVLP